MSTPALHPWISAFTDSLRAIGKDSTAAMHAQRLTGFVRWLETVGVDLAAVTRDDLVRYQTWVRGYRRADGRTYAPTTQAGLIGSVCACFRWLHRHGLIPVNPAVRLVQPRLPRQLVVRKDYLDDQELIALVHTVIAVADETTDPLPRVRAIRNAVLIILACITGRRSHGLLDLHWTDVDLDRAEVRVAVEKGRTGRVLPMATWMVGLLARYRRDAWPVLDRGRGLPWLFPGWHAEQLCAGAYQSILQAAVAETIRRNPDLLDLPAKSITTHSLRVTYATTLHAHGCPIRSLNALLLHDNLSTTARYTMVATDALRSALLQGHPRAGR